ncbi:MAG: hypothetical protein OHK0012_26530 [Synechococcales cyanobacterium]
MVLFRRLVNVSLILTEALGTLAREQPEYWLNPKQTWDPESMLLLQKIVDFLKISQANLGIVGAVDLLLRRLLKPEFFTTPTHTYLVTQVGQLWQPEPAPESQGLPIGVILLDADNQTLDTDKEQWLQEVTETQVNYKFAFANWKAKNNDIDLKKRGYYLFHAPAGDDMADGLMIAFASTIPHHYPEVGRVFVCSNDRTFDNLVAALQRSGVTCLRVIQQNRHRFRIHDYQSETVYAYKPPIPSKGQFIQHLLQLIQDLTRGDQVWVPVTLVEEKYQDRFGLTPQEILQAQQSEHQSLTHFFRSLRQQCVVHSLQGQDYVCRFVREIEPTKLPGNGPRNGQTPGETTPNAAMEMIQIITELIQSQGTPPGEFINPAVITTGYHAKYGHGIVEGLRQRGLGSNIQAFLKRHPHHFTIRTGQSGQWDVAYAIIPAAS